MSLSKSKENPVKKVQIPNIPIQKETSGKVKGVNESVYYEDLLLNVALDNERYLKEIEKIDAEIKELEVRKAAVVEENKVMVVLHEASKRFNIGMVIEDEILSENSRINHSNILVKLREKLNVNTLSKQNLKDVDDYLENNNLVSKNSFGYCKSVPDESDDDDDEEVSVKRAGRYNPKYDYSKEED